MPERAIWEGRDGKAYTYFRLSLDDGIKPKPGNYIMVRREPDGGFTPLYIGETNNLLNRLANHEQWACALEKGMNELHVHQTSGTLQRRLAEESNLIERFAPLPCGGDVGPLQEWAQKMWIVLVSAASKRQTIRYGELAKAVGYTGPYQSVGKYLYPIKIYCDRNGLPPLTILVVAKRTGRPSLDIVNSDERDEHREGVFDHPWLHGLPPTLEELLV